MDSMGAGRRAAPPALHPRPDSMETPESTGDESARVRSDHIPYDIVLIHVLCRPFKSRRQLAIHRRLKSVSSPATFCRILKLLIIKINK